MTHAITYNLGFDDYLAAARARAAAGRFGRHARWLRYLVVVAAFLAIMIGQTISDGGSVTAMLQDAQSVGLIVGGAVMMVLVCLVIDLVFDRVVLRWSFGRFAMANAAFAVTLDAEGVHYSASSVSGTLGWPRVRRVDVTPDYIFLFMSKIEVMALPRRAFATESAFTEAARYAQAQADTATRAP